MFIQRNSTLSNGWEYYTDDAYDGATTTPLKLAVNNDRVQITCNEATSITTNGPAGRGPLWASNAIQAERAGEAFICRVDFSCTPSGVTDYAELQWDIGGGGSIVVVDKTIAFEKTGDTQVSKTVALFTGSTFAANGCKIYLDTTTSADSIEIFNIAILIQKVA